MNHYYQTHTHTVVAERESKKMVSRLDLIIRESIMSLKVQSAIIAEEIYIRYLVD